MTFQFVNWKITPVEALIRKFKAMNEESTPMPPASTKPVESPKQDMQSIGQVGPTIKVSPDKLGTQNTNALGQMFYSPTGVRDVANGNIEAAATMTSPYGPRNLSFSSYHNGIDYSKGPGSKLYSPLGGKVVAVLSESEGGAAGNMIVVESVDPNTGKKYEWKVLHGDAKSTLNVGQEIKLGDYLGFNEGATGRITGPHLDFRIREITGGKVGKWIDPEKVDWVKVAKSQQGNVSLGEG